MLGEGYLVKVAQEYDFKGEFEFILNQPVEVNDIVLVPIPDSINPETGDYEVTYAVVLSVRKVILYSR